MSRVLIDTQLFLSSYSPLFVLLGLRFEIPWLRVVCFALGVVFAVDLGFTLWRLKRVEPRQFELVRVEDRGDEVAGYLVTYLLPFLTVATPSGWDLAAYGFFILIVGVIYVRSGMIYVNPLLYVAGYRLFSVTANPGLDTMLITRQPPRVGQEIWASRLRSHLLLGAAPP